MPHVETNGIQMYYEERGSGDPLILIMGITAPGAVWEVHAGHWEQNYRCIMVDNRGIGQTDKPEGDYNSAMMADDYAGLMDALGIDKAHVVGISMGGVIAQLITARHGKRVRSLTSVMSASRSIDPALIADLWTTPKPREEAIEEWVDYMHTFGSKAMLADDEYYRQQAAAAFDRCYAPDGANRQILAICAAGNVSELARSISVPSLVVHGAGDLLVPPEAGQETAQLIAGARFELIEGMGHDIPPALGQPLSAIIIDHICSAKNQ